MASADIRALLLLAGFEVRGPLFDNCDGIEWIAYDMADLGIESQGDMFLAFFNGVTFN